MDSMRMARILGWAGIIPLILANLGFWKGYGVVALTLGNMYAAIILGFLGAIHWGLAMNRDNSDDAPMLIIGSICLNGYLHGGRETDRNLTTCP